MSRWLGIDHGARRWGVAYGDELGVATPLPALVQADPARRWQALGELLRARRVTEVVLGHPLNMDDSAGFKAREAEAFAERIRSEWGLPVRLVDERLTSYEAEAAVPKKKRREVRASGVIDSRAAAILLQEFLDHRAP